MEIEVKILKTFPASSKLRAVASVTIGGCFAVHGLKIFDSKNGQFVAMPNVKVGNHYVDTFHAIRLGSCTSSKETSQRSVISRWSRARPSRTFPSRKPVKWPSEYTLIIRRELCREETNRPLHR